MFNLCPVSCGYENNWKSFRFLFFNVMQLQLAWGLPLLDFKLSTVIPPEDHRELCTKARSLDLTKHPVGFQPEKF